MNDIEVRLRVTKQVYYNWENGFRVLSCVPEDPFDYPKELKLNKYGNFTLSGTALSQFDIGQCYSLKIRPDQKGKYEASYKASGFQGVDVDFDTNTIEVTPEAQKEGLCRMMTPQQAQYVTDAYPDFVQRILRGQEDTIDYKNIYNVGKVRIEEYIDKVKSNYRTILFYPVCETWGITDEGEVERVTTKYELPNMFEADIERNPYRRLVGEFNHRFEQADRVILKNKPEMIDSVERCEYACLEVLEQNELEGDTRLNANTLAYMVKEFAPECIDKIVEAVTQSKTIHYEPERKYAALQKTYDAEQNIATNIKTRLEMSEESAEKCVEMSQNSVEKCDKYGEIDGFKLTDEQMGILRLAQTSGVAMLTGSGGCGKSFSMKALITMLDDTHHSYTLLAPTGVAAKRLREATGRKSTTIHMALFTVKEWGEYIIIDESSMLSVHLLSSLLEVVPKSSRLIFIADEAQLASISCGNVVQDMIDSGVIPRANLAKVFRYGIGGIATVATDVRFGNPSSFTNQFSDYTYIQTKDAKDQTVDEYQKMVDKGYHPNDILVLCPYNKTPVGTYALNTAIQSKFNPHVDTGISYKRDGAVISFRLGDKVLNTKNNYHMPMLDYDDDMQLVDTGAETFIANGDMGTIRAYKHDEEDTYLIVQFDNTFVRVSGKDIKELLLGYAVSVHKSQGSQAPAVIVVIDKMHSKMISRNLVYVATSRAQKELVVIGDEGTIAEGLKVQENTRRSTYLCEMLRGERNGTV